MPEQETRPPQESGQLTPEEITELTSPENKSESAKDKGDKDEVIRLSVLEALSAYREAVDAGDDPETAKAKGVQKINELTAGEYDDLAAPATEQFMADLKKEPAAPPPAGLPVEAEGAGQTLPAEQGPKAKSVEEILEDVRRLDEMVKETEEEAKSKVQAALDVLHGLIDEAEQAGLNVVKYRNIIANVIPRDYMRDIDGFLSGPDKPVLMTADNFEEYKTKYETIVTDTLAFIEKTRTDFLLDKMEQVGEKVKSEAQAKKTPEEPEKIPAGEKESAEANREKLNQSINAAIQKFSDKLVAGSSPEKARGEAIVEFERLTSDITNTGDENVEASNTLQTRLEELMLAEKTKETGESRLNNVVAACMETYRSAIDSGRSVSQAEEASMQKFVELIKGIKNENADANTVSSLMGELKSEWKKAEEALNYEIPILHKIAHTKKRCRKATAF